MTLNEPGLIFMAVAFWVMYTREWYAHRRTQRDLANAMALEQQERARRQATERHLFAIQPYWDPKALLHELDGPSEAPP